MINQIEGFKYSSNIKLDLSKKNKVIQYIPTINTSIAFEEVLNNILSTDNNRQASRLLYGAYGTGKSSFLTILASILGNSNTKATNKIIIKNFEMVNKDLSIIMKDYIESNKRYLIVPIDGYLEDFQDCVYHSLVKVLDDNQIDYIIHEPYLEAVEIIQNWEKEDNVEINKILNKILIGNNLTLKDFINALRNFDKYAFEIFNTIFNNITCGVDFRHKFVSLDDNLNTINSAIEKQGYEGIIFIFDEFGKYLEDNAMSVRAKTIQDIAEYCDNSNYNNHIILVSHKEISQYNLSEGIEEWKKIESRFEPISFHQDDEEIFYLIKNVLHKDSKSWETFKERFEDSFKCIIKQTYEDDYYTRFSENNLIANIIYGLYPLHPLAARMLVMLSKRIAQNERTIFTFLASNEEKSLGEFIRVSSQEEFKFVGADNIYDYFQNNLSKNRLSYEFNIWTQLKSAINKLDKKDNKFDIKIKIIKTVAIINIINNFDSIRPDLKTIINSIDEEKDKLCESIEEMSNSKILIYTRQYKYYNFFDTSTLDVEKMIDETISRSDNIDQSVQYLNDKYTILPILPDIYNNLYKMTRYYYPIFIEDKDIGILRDLLEREYYDGLIVYLVTNKDLTEVIDKMNGNRIIYVYKKDTQSILKEIKKIIAIDYLLTQKEDLNKKDPRAIIELEEYKKEIDNYIRINIFDWNNPSNKENTFVQNSTILQEIKSINSLSNHMSTEMEKVFGKALIVNNELINKNKLSSVMRRARREIISKLLLEEVTENSLGYKELSINYTFIRSVMILNNITISETNFSPLLKSDDLRMENANYIMDEIKKFVEKSEIRNIDFSEIINTLRFEPYGIRDGYLMLLIAVALIRHKGSIYISYKDKDQIIDGDLFERIQKDPNKYTLRIDKLVQDKENYITKLELEYKDFINNDIRKSNRLKALHDGMQSHYKSVSRFSRSSEKAISNEMSVYREIIENDTEDYRDFFFVKMNRLGTDYEERIINIKQSKLELENSVKKLKLELKEILKVIFKLEKETLIQRKLIELINTDWYNNIKGGLSYETNKFIDLILESNKDLPDEDLIESLAVSLTGFELKYWNDKQITDFTEDIKTINNELTDKKRLTKSKALRISIEDDSGKIKIIGVDTDALPQNSSILKNILLANIDNFGQAISYEDLRQVISEILIKYI